MRLFANGWRERSTNGVRSRLFLEHLFVMKFNRNTMKSCLAVLSVCFLLIGLCGCNSRPDPRENPDFNEEAYSDPGAVLSTMKGGPKTGP